VKLLIAIALVVGSAGAAAGDDRAGELVVIVNPANDARPGDAVLEKIFLRKQTEWPDGDRAIPLNAPPDDDRRHAFDRAVLGMSPDEVARYWLDLRIRGGGTAPREVGDAVLTVKLVAKLKGAIGYVPAGTSVEGVRIVARVRNNKVVPP
jgi:ABC-type phosphate transport system substrate-binding protein